MTTTTQTTTATSLVLRYVGKLVTSQLLAAATSVFVLLVLGTLDVDHQFSVMLTAVVYGTVFGLEFGSWLGQQR